LDVSPRNNRDCVAIAERAWMYPGQMSLIHEILHGTGGARLPVSRTYDMDAKSLLLEFRHVVDRQPGISQTYENETVPFHALVFRRRRLAGNRTIIRDGGNFRNLSIASIAPAVIRTNELVVLDPSQ